MAAPAAPAARQIARAAGTIVVAFAISNLVGLARDALVAGTFGLGAEMDAFNAANRVTEVLFNLVAGGALGSAFIPTFTGYLSKEDRAGAWRLASGVVNLLILALVLVSALAALFAPQIVRYGLFVLAPGENPALQGLTVQLLRIQLTSVTIFGVSGLVMGILNAHQVFLIPALAPSMYSFGWILGALLLAPRWGITGLAWGVVLGSALHLVVQAPSLLRLHGRYDLLFGVRDAAVREVVRLMAPRMFGVAVVQLNFVVNTIIALSLPEGSTTAIGYGFRLMFMPQAAIAQSIAIAALPTFSAQVALGRLDEMRSALGATLRGVLLLAVPASAGLILLSRPLTALVYQRGSFTAQDTSLVAWALLFYAAGLVSHSVVEILSRAFYALHDTRTPVLMTAGSMALNIGLSLVLTRAFAGAGWPALGGLALANSLATTLEMAGLLWFMRRRLGGLEGRAVVGGLAEAAAGALGMSAALGAWLALSARWPAALVAVPGAALGAGVYGFVLLALGVREARGLTRLASARLRRAG